MENLVELMQRLLEIQSGGRQRSPELIAEDDRLMDSLQKRMISTAPVSYTHLGIDDLRPSRKLNEVGRDVQRRPNVHVD